MHRNRNTSSIQSAPEAVTSPVLVALAWLFVAIPAGWGIYNTLLNALKLLHNTR